MQRYDKQRRTLPALLALCLLALGTVPAYGINIPADDSPLILIAETVLHDTHAYDDGAPGTGVLPHATPPDKALHAWDAVDAGTLDDMRGGFDTSLQLKLSFGIERAVYLNGALVTTTSFNLPALGGAVRDNAAPVSVSSGSLSLLQNGPGNSFALSAAVAPLAATVIQNTLNNQSIQGLTTINANVNSLELLRSTGFQTLVREGLGSAIVPH